MPSHETTLYFSSDPANGAEQPSQDGSSFAVELEPPLVLPSNAVSIECALTGAQIWFNAPNVTRANDWWPTTPAPPPYDPLNKIFLPEGLYGVSELNQWALYNTANTISFAAENATGRIRITSTVNATLYFDAAGSIGPLLGFTATVNIPAGESVVGDSPARLNSLNLYLIEATEGAFSSGGIPFNGVRSGTLGVVPVPKGTSPGEQIKFDPQQLLWVDARHLAGQPVANARFRLTDDERRPVDTQTEFYSFTLALRWSTA